MTKDFILENTFLGVRMTRVTDGTDESINVRWALFTLGLELFAENPLFGVGLGNYRYYSPGNLEAHSELAEVLSSTGIVGAILYYSIYLMLIRRLLILLPYLSDEPSQFMARFTITATLTMVSVAAITMSSFVSPDRLITLAIFIGISHRLTIIHTVRRPCINA